jgi:hypothetical protein
MFQGFLLKKLIPQVIPHIKPGLKKLVELGKDYAATIPLERGEFVVGLVMLSGDKYIVASCVAKQTEKKIEIQRHVDFREGDELAELLITNIGNVDFSTALSSDNPEND